jgi:hypothetical protein
MIPSASNLTKLVGKKIEMDLKLTSQPAIEAGVMEKSYGVSLNVAGDTVKLDRIDSSSDGTWVPYAEGKAVVGYLKERNWVASGPFSGCQFAVGINKSTQKVYAAHIAKQSGSTGEADYKKYRDNKKLSEWYWNKIPLPNPAKFSCSYIFVICDKSGISAMIRLDADVTKMGGSDGTITNVHVYK